MMHNNKYCAQEYCKLFDYSHSCLLFPIESQGVVRGC